MELRLHEILYFVPNPFMKAPDSLLNSVIAGISHDKNNTLQNWTGFKQDAVVYKKNCYQDYLKKGLCIVLIRAIWFALNIEALDIKRISGEGFVETCWATFDVQLYILNMVTFAKYHHNKITYK